MKPIKSQWDFGELFDPITTRHVLTVSELTQQVRSLLEKQIGQVWVTGEITNLRVQSSGHIYFTLKDASAQLACVLFRGEVAAHRELLQDGQKVILQGDITVYEARGQYQMIVRSLELRGVGALQIAFEKLKQKLQAEGLFAPERKRPLPRYPQCIGLVTSPTGAAIRDVLHVIQRRQPGLQIVLAPCRVQGEGAAEEIAGAIRLLNQWASQCSKGPTLQHTALDLIVVSRGGGSLEDLWPFNGEVVARAIFDSMLPVMSAVGHEIDFTISDFVADLRAATPSAAAELITEGAFASRQFVAETSSYLGKLVRERCAREQANLRQLSQRLGRAHPRRRFDEKLQRLDDLQSSLMRLASSSLWKNRMDSDSLRQRLARAKPSQTLSRCRAALVQLAERWQQQAALQLRERRNRLDHAEARLRLLSPQNVLERGYSITMDAPSGQVIRAADEVKPGQRLRTRFKSGAVQSVVEL